jgi:hypothetical protein
MADVQSQRLGIETLNNYAGKPDIGVLCKPFHTGEIRVRHDESLNTELFELFSTLLRACEDLYIVILDVG